LLAFLLFVTPNSTSASKVLATFCLLLGINFITANLYQQSNYIEFPRLIGLTEFIPASYGALLYLYLVSALTGTSIKGRQWLHLWPIVICYMLGFPQLIAAPDVKIQLVEAIMFGQSIPLNFTIALKLVFVQAFGYALFSLWFLYNYYQQAQQNLSEFNRSMFMWLGVFMSLYLVTWIFKSFSILVWLGDVFIVLMTTAIAVFQWRKPYLFTTPIPLSRSLQTALGESKPITDAPVVNVNEETRYGESRLPDDLLNTMAEQANNYMANQKPYLDSQLTLIKLASDLGFTTHQLSQVVNLNEGKNFYQWVNQYRVDDVINNLSQRPESKILDIALACGFSSKSSFNSVFKNLTQMTPSQYKKFIAEAD